MIRFAGAPSAVRELATAMPSALSSALAFSTFSSAAERAAVVAATENSVIGAPTGCARTAARRTACIERDVPSVQMRKPFLSKLSRATRTEQGDSIVTRSTTPLENQDFLSPRQLEDSPRIIRL